jgi:sortase (surface protein transpeptidase)
VQPEDTDVLDDSGRALLTLVTCYPFHYIGPAPERFVVVAHGVKKVQASNREQKSSDLRAAPERSAFARALP